MTGDDATSPTRLAPLVRRCWVGAGLLLLVGLLHPDIFETTLADAALDTSLWVPIHAAAVVVVVLTLFGLPGLYARRADRLDRLGAIGFALAVPGLVVTACVAYAEAFLLPIIAANTPEVFAWDGQWSRPGPFVSRPVWDFFGLSGSSCWGWPCGDLAPCRDPRP